MNLKLKNLKRLSYLTLALTITLSSLNLSTVSAGGFDKNNDPSVVEPYLGLHLKTNLNELPRSGQLKGKKRPWTCDYWASKFHGIARNWSGEGSPAKKFDKVAGTSIASQEWFRTGGMFSRLRAAWEGICHGWAPAAIHFEEPGSCVYKGVTFHSGDIKALLSLMQGNYNKNPNCQVGTRCGTNNIRASDVINARSDNAVNDINPGAFYILLANGIALNDLGFVMDRTAGNEVWNQPVEGYKVISSRLLATVDRSVAAANTAKEVEMEIDVTYTSEMEPNKEPENEKAGEPDKEFRTHIQYKFILELDRNNEIIGGRWLSEDHPDFVWFSKKAEFPAPFGQTLKEIYEQSLINKAKNQ